MENTMENTKKTPVYIDNVEYIYEELAEEKQMIINHLADLDRKISSTKFNLNQLEVGKQAFMNMFHKEEVSE